jgi:hypothetical protein
MDQKSFGG